MVNPEELRIRLLGEFRVYIGDHEIDANHWRLRKAKSLVKLLALAPSHRLHREQLMELLWPENEPELAVNNLHRAIYVARHSLHPTHGGRYLQFQGEWLYLSPETPLWIDVEAFEAAANQARSSKDPAAYSTALELYAGELLPEDRYENWASERREALRQEHLRLLLELARLHETRSEYGPAIEASKRLLSSDPSYEEAHASLMRLYALTGQRQQALRQYQTLQEALKLEFDAEPEPNISRLHQEILSGRFPPADTTTSSRPESIVEQLTPEPDRPLHNLPIQLTSFVGRDQELAELRTLLLPTPGGRMGQPLVSGERFAASFGGEGGLLTLTGAGGCGKTRLALEAAGELVEDYPHGIWLAELAGLSDPDLVPQGVAAILGVRELPGKPLVESLVAFLKPRQLLLLLDNCEHLIEACARIVKALLQACPGLRILATSREPLRLPGERLFPVLPLSVPDRQQLPPLEALAGFEAVRLFVERAQAVQPDFELTARNAPFVIQVCSRLDGLPLAIELAAARTNLLSIEQIAARLDDRFRLLTYGDRTAPDRQQTLQAALDWSYQLLSAPEQALFRRLSVFAGGWTLDAADEMASGDFGDVETEAPFIPNSQFGILDLLSHLVDKSLVTVERTEGGRRYRLLETVRAYAWERLKESGEAEVICRRHAEHFLTLAERAEPELRSSRQPEWLARLEQEHDNLRAALAWCLSRDEAELGQRLAGALWYFWFVRNYFGEGLRWFEKVLASSRGAAVTRAKALVGAGFLASIMTAYLEQVKAHAEESLALAQDTGDQKIVVYSLFLLGSYYFRKHDYTRALALDEECLALVPDTGDLWLTAFALTWLGWDLGVLWSDLEGATARAQEALRLAREVADQRLIAYSLFYRGECAVQLGDFSLARRCLEESLSITHTLGDRFGMATAYMELGFLAFTRGDLASAYRHLEERLSIERELDNKPGIVHSLNAVGMVAHAMGHDGKAQALFEESLGLCREFDYDWGGAVQLNSLGFLNLRRGKAEQAQGYFLKSLKLYREMKDLHLLASNLYALSKIALLQGQLQRAARWLGAVGPAFDYPGSYLDPNFKIWFDADEYARDLAEVKARLDEATFSTEWEAGRALGLEGAIQEVLIIQDMKPQN